MLAWNSKQKKKNFKNQYHNFKHYIWSIKWLVLLDHEKEEVVVEGKIKMVGEQTVWYTRSYLAFILARNKVLFEILDAKGEMIVVLLFLKFVTLSPLFFTYVGLQVNLRACKTHKKRWSNLLLCYSLFSSSVPWNRSWLELVKLWFTEWKTYQLL
jgi:hypothetical protein